ncbi:hypothetical protein E2C01_008895 [Portunus trituberculatus]|uniref:Uncharacterized protein n=1 Tax=Portunus trituberculatus TaxID=210409 RepID=A0A5B7D204_PORTR|nr:hypothetical protein [Portunus trituberculatus]
MAWKPSPTQPPEPPCSLASPQGCVLSEGSFLDLTFLPLVTRDSQPPFSLSYTPLVGMNQTPCRREQNKGSAMAI